MLVQSTASYTYTSFSNHNMRHSWFSWGTSAHCCKRIHFHRPNQLPLPYQSQRASLHGNPLWVSVTPFFCLCYRWMFSCCAYNRFPYISQYKVIQSATTCVRYPQPSTNFWDWFVISYMLEPNHIIELKICSIRYFQCVTSRYVNTSLTICDGSAIVYLYFPY